MQAVKSKVKKKGEYSLKFLELMADEKIQLPLIEDENYENTLKELYRYYCQKVSEFMTEPQVKAIQMICHHILKMINQYNDDAYKTFEDLMKIHIFKNNLHIIEDKLPVDGYGRSNINLFRLRNVHENRKYKRKEIFHDPRNKNTDAYRKPYRYNLEERPSLYLSSTVYCCHKELGTDIDKQRMIGSLFRMNPESQSQFYIVDLANRPIDYVKRSNQYKKANIGYEENAYLFVYPFIAACSVVVPNKDKRNICEYKITNILYKWLVKNHGDKLCGIRYFSCHDSIYCITDKNNDLIFERRSQTSFTKYFINYAFPIGNELDDDGYCCKLKNNFIVSYPRFLKEFATIQEFEKEIKKSTSLTKI